MKEALISHRDRIEVANSEDIAEATLLAAEGKIAQTLVERLGLYGSKFDSLMRMVESVSQLPDPLGNVSYSHNMISDGSLSVHRVSCAIGVIAVIFESRPEAAVQIASLCVKSGNAVVLKGGKEARRTVGLLVDIMRSVVGEAVQIAETREDITTLLRMDKYVDLVIPRGGAELVKYCKQNTTIPVLGHADGICAIYIHNDANIEMAINIVVDAKTQYPAVCNAAETLLLNADIPEDKIRDIVKALVDKRIQIRACTRTKSLLEGMPGVILAKTEDFKTEYCDLILAVRMVDSLEEAIAHINDNGSHHSDCIVTSNPSAALKFMESVDSADVMWNASTRFADGNRFGFGAEVGVSTNKIHARGPVGLEGLTTYKYRVYGDGQTVGRDGPNLIPVASLPTTGKVTVHDLDRRYHT
jgi:glutamate-5-semialdehyde dehydrogenase